MVGHNKKNKGYEVETFVLDKFLELGFSAQTRNAYYDLDLEKNNIKKQLEIKSTNFIIKNGSGVLTYGRFYFDVSNVKDQVKNNVDVCFVVCIKESFEIIGFMNIKTALKKFKAKKYVTLKDLMSCRFTKFNKYIDKFISK